MFVKKKESVLSHPPPCFLFLLLLPGRERGRKEGSRDKKERVSFFYLFCYTPEVPLYVPKKAFLATFIRGGSLSTFWPVGTKFERAFIYRRQKFGKPRGVTNWFVPSKKKEEEEEKELVNFSLSLLLAITDRKWLSDTRQNNDNIFEIGKAEFEGNRSFLADFWNLTPFYFSFFSSFLSLILFLRQYLPTSESMYIYISLPSFPPWLCLPKSVMCCAVIRISGLPSSMHCSMACVPSRPNYCQKSPSTNEWIRPIGHQPPPYTFLPVKIRYFFFFKPFFPLLS